MISLYKESILPCYSKVSAKKIAVSLIRGSYEGYDDIKPVEIQPQIHNKEQADKIQTNEELKGSNITRLQEEINAINQKLEENRNALCQIESYIMDMNRLKSEISIDQSKFDPIYQVLESSLLKRVLIQVNGSEMQGILTEVSHEYVKLIECDYVVFIPLSKIDIIKIKL